MEAAAIACLVRSTRSSDNFDKTYVLSNIQAFANINQAHIGDHVDLQRPLDGGIPAETIAVFCELGPDAKVDKA